MNYQEPNYQNHQFYGNEIKITNAFISLGSLSEKIRLNEIDIHPNHYMDYYWSEEKMSRLIESILLRIPLPIFYFDVSNPYKWVSIDGLQRLYTIERFIIQNSFSLKNMEVLTHLEGMNYVNLENTYKRIINDTQIITYQIEAQTPQHLREIIFRKIRDINEH